PTQPFDLYILDGWLPNVLPEGDLLIINPPRSTPLFTVGEESRNPGQVRVQSDDPRMNFVDFDSVSLLAYRQISGADWAQTLISAAEGPLLLAGEVDGRQVAVLTFDFHSTVTPSPMLRRILIAILLDWFAPQGAITTSRTLSVGGSIVIRQTLPA